MNRIAPALALVLSSTAAAQSPETNPSVDVAATAPTACDAQWAPMLWDALATHPALAQGDAEADALLGVGRADAAFQDPAVFLEARGLPVTEPWNIGRTPMGGVTGGVQTRIPWLPKLWAKADQREAQAAARRMLTREVRLDLAERLMLLHVERDALDDHIDVAQGRVQLLQALSDVARANAVVGRGGATDAVLLQARAASTQADIAAMQQTYAVLAAQFAEILPEVSMAQCNVSASDVLRAEERGDEDIESRPLFAALAARERAAAAQERGSIHDWVPEPMIKAGYTWRADYGDFDGVDFIGGMLEVPLPLSPGRRLGVRDQGRAGARNVTAERRAATQELRGMRRALMERIAVQSARIVALRNDARPLARSASDVAQAAYRSGQSPVGDVIDAERMVLDIDDAVIAARAERARLRVRLWRITGGPLPSAETSSLVSPRDGAASASSSKESP